jgi:2-methylisocitrate lyase-like PEP mutase family enzyme
VQVNIAKIFAGLHRTGEPLLLANAWDVASAVAIEAAGAKAIATTSAGVAWSLGVPDAAGLGAERAAAVIGRIAAAVSVPVSADIEAGYGDSPDMFAATVAAAVRAGAVGVNLEDRQDGAALFPPAAQAERLAAARAAGGGLPVWINARTDVFPSGTCPSIHAGVAAALERAGAYQAAGADSLGIACNLYGTAPTQTKKIGAFANPLIAVHAVVGTLLIIGAIYLTAVAARARIASVIALSVIGLLSLLAAWAAGSAFSQTAANGYSMAMGVMTAVALLCYSVNVRILAGHKDGQQATLRS